VDIIEEDKYSIAGDPIIIGYLFEPFGNGIAL
jgi:hypothetical protein